MDDKTKYEIISRVQRKIQPKDIAEELDVAYSSVIRVRKQYEDAVIAGTVDKLLDIDKLMITELADKYPIDEVNKLVKSVDGLEVLNVELQTSATQINQRVKSMLHSVEHASELAELTDIVCKLQNAFFNKNTTQVNVQNNTYGDSNDNPYNQFLSDAPGTIN